MKAMDMHSLFQERTLMLRYTKSKQFGQAFNQSKRMHKRVREFLDVLRANHKKGFKTLSSKVTARHTLILMLKVAQSHLSGDPRFTTEDFISSVEFIDNHFKALHNNIPSKLLYGQYEK